MKKNHILGPATRMYMGTDADVAGPEIQGKKTNSKKGPIIGKKFNQVCK